MNNGIIKSKIYFQTNLNWEILDFSEDAVDLLTIDYSKAKGKNFFDSVIFQIDKESVEAFFKNKTYIHSTVLAKNSNKSYFIEIKRNEKEKKYSINLVEIEDKFFVAANEATIGKDLFPGFRYMTFIEQFNERYVFSENVVNLLGFTANELIGSKGGLLSIIVKEDLPGVIKAKNDFKNSNKKKTIDINYRVQKKNGKKIWLQESIFAERNEKGKAVVFYSQCNDISFLREAYESLLQKEEDLVRANKSRDRFINILSHDLRSPFTSILGFSEILLSENELSPAEKNEYLNYIYEASKNQLEFINYLLDWSRLRSNTLKIEQQRLKTSLIIYNAISALTGNAIRKNININVDVPDDLYIQADVRLMNQVILNLLSNSIKFSFENSSIDITANLFNQTQAEIIIKDYGKGLTADEKEKLYSLEASFTTEGTKGEKGTGLGLALVKEIVEKHGGEIWFYSEEGSGTEFHFTVPIPTNTIYLISPENNLTSQIEDILIDNFSKFNIVKEKNSYEALQRINNIHPTLIVINNDLPLMTAIQFLESLQTSSNSLRYQALVFGENISNENESQLLKFGIKKTFSSPINEKEFISALNELLF